MWDRLLIDCHVATMVPARGDPLGIVTNAAIGIQDGKVVRVGKRTELAGFKAAEVVPLGGGWVTPGLIDCHTHLVFGGNRADEHALRRAGASYEEIARAGGGIRHGRTQGGPIAVQVGNTEWPKWETVMAPDPVDPRSASGAASGRGG